MPKFGNWETEENVPYTTYFENARRVSSGERVNPSNSPDNPNLVSKFETRRGSEAARAKHENMLSQENGELQKSCGSPSRPNGGRKASVNSTHYQPAGVSSDTPKRSARANGGGFRSADQSPLHPHYQAKIGAKGSAVSSDGNHGLAPSTPGRSRLRSVARGNETPDRGASVPKFGEWDETDPSSADGFTHIFNKVKEERHGVGNTTGKATPTRQYDGKHYRRKNSKGCWCLPW